MSRAVRNALLAIVVFAAVAAASPRIAVAQSPQPSAPADAARPAPPPMQSTSIGPPSMVATPMAPVVRPDADRRELRSEGTALALSLTGTLVSWSMLFLGAQADDGGRVALLGLAGTFFAPNFGHWYQGVPFTRGTGLRLAGGATATFALFRAILEAGRNEETDMYLFIGGALVYLAGTIDDLIDAPRRARRHNRGLQLGAAPMVTDRGAGFALGGSF